MLTNVLEYLEESAVRYPDKISYSDEERVLSFSVLLQEAKAIGSFLLTERKKQAPVLIFMEKGAHNISAFMGVLYSGNFYCPIDTEMPSARIQVILETLQPFAILYDAVNADKVHALQFDGLLLPYEEAVQCTVDEERLAEIRETCLDTDPVYVLFTSGSTGVPKGVIINHRAVIDFTDWMTKKFNITSEDNFANQSPFYFDLSVGDLFCTLKTGCTNYIVPKRLFTFPVKLVEYLNEKKVTIIFWVPSALCLVANLRALKKAQPQYLDRVLFCGEVMPNKQLNVWRQALPNTTFVNLYGPSEATDACTYYIVDREFADDEPLPIGFPCANTEILVLDEQDELVSGDEIGELCIRGSGLAMGYYNNLERTAEAFVQNPLNKVYPEIIYRTGDLVRYNEYGELMYVSRKDFQIKHMGHRIELGEIETAAATIVEVATCACIYDDVKQNIVFFYEGQRIDELMIKEALKMKVQGYMIPGVVIYMEQLPHNANGKIDRKRLKEAYLAGEIN